MAKMMRVILKASFFLYGVCTVLGKQLRDSLADCPGYKATNVRIGPDGLEADLTLAGPACNVYSDDLHRLTLTVKYETEARLHVKIQDAENRVYQVPESVLPRPTGSGWPSATADLTFQYTEDPFSFAVSRRSDGEVLFDTSGAEIVFQSQYLRLRTRLPDDPYLYGLGEHSDSFRLRTHDYIRTIWARDSYAIPVGTNLVCKLTSFSYPFGTGAHSRSKTSAFPPDHSPPSSGPGPKETKTNS